ncbi:MAG: hypothetical protein AAF539_00720 [Planctomycetota bacterium]
MARSSYASGKIIDRRRRFGGVEGLAGAGASVVAGINMKLKAI